jgi:hypothetical protein
MSGSFRSRREADADLSDRDRLGIGFSPLADLVVEGIH